MSPVPKTDATHAIWQDPSTYDPEAHGPPYLREKLSSESRETVRGLLRVAARGHVPVLHKMAGGAGPELGTILAFLRALAAVHQAAHWQTRGPDAYADHLLFERLYGDLLPEIDAVAERAVVEESDAVNPIEQTRQVAGLVESLGYGPRDAQGLVNISLDAEKKYLLVSQILVKRLKGRGALSRGTDNLLAGIEDKHETHVYLLHQRAGKLA